MLGAQVGRRGAKKGLESGIYLTDIAEPLCDAERHKEDAERPELRYHAERGSDDQHPPGPQTKTPRTGRGVFLLPGYQLSRFRVSRAGFSPRGRAGNWSSCSADGKRSIFDSLCTIFG